MKLNAHIRSYAAQQAGVGWGTLMAEAQRQQIDWLVATDLNYWPTTFDSRHVGKIYGVEVATNLTGKEVHIIAYYTAPSQPFLAFMKAQEEHCTVLNKSRPIRVSDRGMVLACHDTWIARFPTTQMVVETIRSSGGLAVISGWGLKYLSYEMLNELVMRGVQGIDLNALPPQESCLVDLEDFSVRSKLLTIRGSIGSKWEFDGLVPCMEGAEVDQFLSKLFLG